jgi:HSP20 family protein
MMLTAYTPLERQIDRFLSDVLGADNGATAAWSPRCNVYEDVNGFSVQAALAGVDPKMVHTVVEDGVLTISGERKDVSAEEARAYYAREIVSGPFTRSFRLPTNVDTEKASASYRDGVLTIDLPKKEEAKPRRITIESK